MDIDYAPISWNKRLMHIRASIETGNDDVNNFNEFVTLKKFTGNTIKKNYTSFNPNTGKACYGSHNKNCFGCKIPIKTIQKNQTNFKRHIVGGEIKDNNSNDY